MCAISQKEIKTPSLMKIVLIFKLSLSIERMVGACMCAWQGLRGFFFLIP